MMISLDIFAKEKSPPNHLPLMDDTVSLGHFVYFIYKSNLLGFSLALD